MHRFLDEGLNINCPTIFHAGVRDQHVPLDLLNTIRGLLKTTVAFHLYDADHAFANTHRPELFQAAPIERAHKLSFKLLHCFNLNPMTKSNRNPVVLGFLSFVWVQAFLDIEEACTLYSSKLTRKNPIFSIYRPKRNLISSIGGSSIS